MAGGNITRIVGGKQSMETDEWIVYTDKFTAYAGKGSHFTADLGMMMGDPNDPPTGKKHFEKGYWTNERANASKRLNWEIKFSFI